MRLVHRYRRVVLLIALLTTVYGQVFAYPRICAMPGMDMHGMAMAATANVAPKTGSAQEMEIESAQLPSAADSTPGEATAYSNCEQICGYCLSFNFPHASRQVTALEYTPSLPFAWQPAFYLSVLPDGLFRPPIPA